MANVVQTPRKSRGQSPSHPAKLEYPDLEIAGADLETIEPNAAEPWNDPNTRQVKPSKPDAVVETAADRKRFANLSWWAIGWLGVAHLVVLFVAPFTFSWTGLGVMLGLHWLTGSIGICLGYHRLLTHSGMKTRTWFKYFLAGVGSLAGEGTPLDWVADHRKHHKHSDQAGDPHSPHDGGWWSHVFWLAYHTHNGKRTAYLQKWAPDLYKLRGMRIMDYLFLPIHIVSGCILYGAGYYFGGAAFGTSLLVWGLFVRLVLVLHATWMVNSASHIWGYKNYETTDDSRNNWLVAIVAYGEGWHNNHHAHPRMAKHGHKWWEFDITWQAIRLFRALGLVWDVVDYRNAKEKKANSELANSESTSDEVANREVTAQ